jgi:hypothetical protein
VIAGQTSFDLRRCSSDVALRWRRCLLSTRLRAPCADKVDDTVSLSSCYTLVPDIAQKARGLGRTDVLRATSSLFVLSESVSDGDGLSLSPHRQHG